MLYAAVTRTGNGLGASVHITEQDAEKSILDYLAETGVNVEGKTLSEAVEDLHEDDDSFEWDVHQISLGGLFSHIEDMRLRLALLTGEDQEYAREYTFRAWWEDNNEGEQPAQALPHRVYEQRENAVVAMGDDSEPLTKNIHAELISYWSI